MSVIAVGETILCSDKKRNASSFRELLPKVEIHENLVQKIT